MSSTSNPTPHQQSKLEARRPPSPLQNGAADDGDPFTRLHNHENLICISDRVDQTLIFPFVSDGPLLDDIVDTILNGMSVLVVGEPGIGKRTLSLGVARRLHAMRASGVSPAVTSRDVYTLSLGREFWKQAQGAAVTEMQNKILQVFRIVEQAGPEKIVFCIDDVDVLSFVDSLVLQQRRRERLSSVSDISDPVLFTENMLRFLLFGKKVLCLCTCIRAAYNRLVATDTYYDEKFSKSFRVFHMPEPTPRHAASIIWAHRERVEAELDVLIRPDALRASVSYANVFLTHRCMPEKAIDLLVEACLAAVTLLEKAIEGGESSSGSATRPVLMEGRPVVDKIYVDEIVLEWCGVSEESLREVYNEAQSYIPSTSSTSTPQDIDGEEEAKT